MPDNRGRAERAQRQESLTKKPENLTRSPRRKQVTDGKVLQGRANQANRDEIREQSKHKIGQTK